MTVDEMSEKLKGKPKQRVSYSSAIDILEKAIKNYESKLYPATTFVEDWAGGSNQFINREIVEQLIKKLTR